jgi:predicted nucleic acid-binding protein
MLVVADTSPILNLAAIGRIDLLRSLYEALVIPPAVEHELAALARRHERFASVSSLPSFVRVEPLPEKQNVRALLAELRLQLHPGEAEALVLAEALPADLLLVDELHARQVARRRGMPTLGLLGVLVAGKRCGLLSAITPLLDQLQDEAGFWVGAELRAHVLSSMDEIPS